MIRFACPSCSTEYQAPDHKAGVTYTCSRCKKKMVVPGTPKATRSAPAEAKTGGWPAPQAMDYPRMQRSLALLRARRQVRRILDASGFGPSAVGRLCLALILCAVVFGVSLVLSLAIHQPPVYAIAQSTGIFLAAFTPFLVLVLGPSDAELATRLDYIVAQLPKAEAAWREQKNQLAVERLKRKQERAEREEPQEQEERRGRSFRRAADARRPAPAVVMPTKNEGISMILTILFGPLGLLYSTVAGGLIMMLVTLLVSFFTCSLGLFIIYPVCILPVCVIWGALAAHSYNQKLWRGQRQ